MNLTLCSLSLNLFKRNMLFTGKKSFSILKSQFTHSPSVLFYNFKNLKISHTKFSNFLTAAIKSEHEQIFTMSGPYYESTDLTHLSTIHISNAIFYSCQTPITSSNENQNISISETSFIETRGSILSLNPVRNINMNSICVNNNNVLLTQQTFLYTI